MLSLSFPEPMKPVETLTLAPPEGPETVQEDEAARLLILSEMITLEKERALAYWQTSLAEGRVHASLILGQLDLESLRKVWRETPTELWRIQPDEGRFLVLTLKEEALATMRALALTGAIGAGALIDVRAPWVALAMARGLVGLSSLRSPSDAYRWLVQHEDIAIDALIYFALQGKENDRQAAQHALRWLARRHRGARVLSAAEARGSAVLEAIRDALHPDRDAPPRFTRALPKAFAALPRLRLKTGETLDAASMEVLGRMLATPLTRAHSAMQQVLAHCEESSTRSLGESLFSLWAGGGMATQTQWIASAYLTLGGDEAARALGRSARTWMRSKETHDKRAARLAVEVLGQLGSDVAIQEVATIASTSRDAETTLRAEQVLVRIALERDTEIDLLGAPTRIPSLVLDYGPRSFTTRLTSRLTLGVHDGERALDELPRPNKKDDAAKAALAKTAFKEAQFAMRDAVRAEVLRFEHAMANEQRWALGRFRARLVSETVALVVAQRVLFEAHHNGATHLFRIDEAGHLVTDDDAPLALGEETWVGVAHRLRMDAASRAQWSRVFLEYALIGPFSQLERTVHLAWPEGELTLHPGAVLGLRSKGWRLLRTHGSEVDTLARTWPSGTLKVFIAPGIRPERALDPEPQKITRIETPGALSLVAQSESIRELLGERQSA